TELGDVSMAHAIGGGPRLHLRRVKGDQRDKIRLAGAIDGALPEERGPLQRLLNIFGCDILASCGNDQGFFAVHNVKETSAIDPADVAGREPALSIERLPCCLRVVVVADEDAGAADQNLTVLGDARLVALKDRPNRAQAMAMHPVEREAATGLG